MSAGKEKVKIYDAVLSSPGMDDVVKVTIQRSRKEVLILARILENGLNSNQENPDSIISLVPKESLEGFRGVIEEILSKSGLTAFNEKLKQL